MLHTLPICYSFDTGIFYLFYLLCFNWGSAEIETQCAMYLDFVQ